MKTYSNKEDKLLIKYLPVRGLKYCSVLLKRPYSSIRSRAKRINIRIEKGVRSKIMKLVAKKRWEEHPKLNGYSVEVDTITDYNPDVCYFLGYFWADGSFSGNSSVRLEIQERDGKSIKKIMFKIGKWGIYVRQRLKFGKPFGQKQMMFNTSNRLLVEHLKKFDFDKKSTYSPTKILNEIPIELHHYFWRGYLDGDGCVYFSKNFRCKSLVFWGTMNQNWKSLIDIYKKLNLKYYKKKYTRITKTNKIHKSSMIGIYREPDIIKFLDFIYSNYNLDRIGLCRKHDKYLKLKKHIELTPN